MAAFIQSGIRSVRWSWAVVSIVMRRIDKQLTKQYYKIRIFNAIVVCVGA